MFLIQLIESYQQQDNDKSLMAMPDLEDPQDKWEVEEVLDCCCIKNTVHYLVKWVGWLSKYNSFEPATHLVNASHAIETFEKKLKCKCKGKNDTAPGKKTHAS